MNTEKWTERLEALNRKLDELGEKAKDASETAQIQGMIAKDELEEKIRDAKGNLEAAKENHRIASEKAKGILSGELLRLQMNAEALQSSLQEKKDAYDQKKLEKYIEDQLDYAQEAEAMAELLLANAALAVLEAVSASEEYAEKYGDPETEKD